MPLRRIRIRRQAAAPDRRLPSWRDVGLALALLAIALAHTRHAGVLGVVLNIAIVVPLIWRRRAPGSVFAVIWTFAAIQGLTRAPTFADSALLVAFYTIAAGSDRRMTGIAGIALAVGIICTVTKLAGGADAWLRAFVALSGLATAAGVLGINVRNRRQVLAALHDRAERLEQEREHELALATAGERSRIAREMHDVVAHNLSVMVALCDGAGYHVHDAPDRVASALEQASRTGRQALAEMRQLLGVLREPPSGPELAPQPGVRQIEDLVEQIRAAGIPVSYSVRGELTGAPPGIELAIHRIVQEALTNTLKHAGPGARASVRLTCTEHTVDVEVTDTGAGGSAPRNGGAGLRGMRERAAVYGGSLQACAVPGGGWCVRTTLQLSAAAPVLR
ncbi:MAG: sensor histidine kinase [Solirubrobacteraceae bacterium]